MDQYKRPIYNALSLAQKEQLLQSLAAHAPGFSFMRMQRYEDSGQLTDTALFQYQDGCEFVFVPGDTVTLGWDVSKSTMNEETRKDISDSLEEYEITDTDAFLQENCTPLRSAEISPMLVERTVREIGWYAVSPDCDAIQQNEQLRGYLQRYLAEQNPGMHEWHNTLKLHYTAGVLKAQLYAPIGYEAFLKQVRADGFDLPNEDEWEYLCGGGSRTLWRWGDSFDYTMKVPHFKINGTQFSRDISQPNQFGLQIAFDPYRYEVLADQAVFLKAGDGGCNICGGLGPVLGFLPVATYYKGVSFDNDQLGYLEDIGGDYTSYRRILRLASNMQPMHV